MTAVVEDIFRPSWSWRVDPTDDSDVHFKVPVTFGGEIDSSTPCSVFFWRVSNELPLLREDAPPPSLELLARFFTPMMDVPVSHQLTCRLPIAIFLFFRHKSGKILLNKYRSLNCGEMHVRIKKS
ncbi:hypothetical protein TNCT_615291 [Trichonephila clavata]|uniref:Uncharacterized protein n=1 Tax=Trichonephila clavata TaxID=2740835 RepID=A0A8X6M1D7_TRICU|nr:hypothetical protein TNCT_615291 [Trichonephila clavata]